MSQDEHLKTKRYHVTREEEADHDLNGTKFSKGSAIAVVAAFLGIVLGVNALQHVLEIRKNLTARQEWNPAGGQPKPPLAPKIYQVVDLLPSREQLARAKGFWGYWSLIPSTQQIEGFESEVKDSSILTQALLSPAQEFLTSKLGVGNEKAYLGQPGWLFYRPDVDYLTADGFLKPSVLKARAHGSKEIQPDPVKAIVNFKQQLAARGIQLVVMPMPTKPMVHPEMLVGPKAAGAELQNPSYDEFKRRLSEAGVALFDPTHELLSRKSQERQYLETDTHWTPEAMDAVSYKLSEFIQGCCSLPAGNLNYQVRPMRVSALGDIAEMLKLPKSQTVFRPQSVTTQQVLTPTGAEWAPEKTGDVLLLGDSFTNIYSLSGMNWGSAAGFAEHLSYHLQRPVDKIAINAGGSFASRQELAREMRRQDRLAGKKVVIYEFSMRDLAQGDWKIIKLPEPPKGEDVPTPPVTPIDTTPVKIIEVVPPSFDPAAGQVATVRLSVPKGTWRAVVYDAAGKPIVTLGQGAAEIAGDAQATWDGKDATGHPVTPGTYKITIAGRREDGSKIEPVSAGVLVASATAPAGKLLAIGASPDRIDAAKGEKTRVSFQVPADARYEAEIADPAGRVLRKLGPLDARAGVLTVSWDGKISGKPAKAGMYAVRIHEGTKPGVSVNVTVVAGSAPQPATTGGGPGKPPIKNPPTNSVQEIVISGRIASRAPSPKPGSVPYKDCLIALQITDIRSISGKVSNANIVVYVWGMRDNNLVDGAYVAGQTVTFKLSPWEKVPANLSGLNRQELEGNDDVYSWPAFFGELKK